LEQQVRFCTTPDRVRLAYAAHGQGLPLVKAATWMTHLEFDWQSPVCAARRDADAGGTAITATIETVGPGGHPASRGGLTLDTDGSTKCGRL
jgi:hypothetical protein